MNIPYDLAVAYWDLALDQMEEHTNAIEREVRDSCSRDFQIAYIVPSRTSWAITKSRLLQAVTC